MIKTSWCLHITLEKSLLLLGLFVQKKLILPKASDQIFRRLDRWVWVQVWCVHWPPQADKCGFVALTQTRLEFADSFITRCSFRYFPSVVQVMRYNCLMNRVSFAGKIPSMLNCKGSTGPPEDFYSSQKKKYFTKISHFLPLIGFGHVGLLNPLK